MRSSREQLPNSDQPTVRVTTPGSAGKPVAALFSEDAAARQRQQQEGEGTPEEVGPAEYARLPLRLSRQVRRSSGFLCSLSLQGCPAVMHVHARSELTMVIKLELVLCCLVVSGDAGTAE